MAAEDSSYCQVKAFERAMLPESLKCVLRTCGGESAARLLERRDAYLVESDQQDERRRGHLLYDLNEAIH